MEQHTEDLSIRQIGKNANPAPDWGLLSSTVPVFLSGPGNDIGKYGFSSDGQLLSGVTGAANVVDQPASTCEAPVQKDNYPERRGPGLYESYASSIKEYRIGDLILDKDNKPLCTANGKPIKIGQIYVAPDKSVYGRQGKSNTWSILEEKASHGLLLLGNNRDQTQSGSRARKYQCLCCIQAP